MPHTYTPAEIAYIKENKGKIPTKDIAAKLGVTEAAIYNVCYKMRLSGVDIPKTKNVFKATQNQKPTDKPFTIKDHSGCKYIKKDSRTWVVVRV